MEDVQYVVHPPNLATIIAATSEIQFGMSSEPLVGALLRLLVASKPGGRFLELGTGTGIATAWLLSGMDAAASLVSVDNDGAVQEIARRALGGDPRLSIITADGIEFLRNQKPASFDLVFADAMPGKYEGLADALAVVSPGGFYVIDDMLPQPNWPAGHKEKIPVLMDQLAKHSDFEMLPLKWASGVVISVRKNCSV